MQAEILAANPASRIRILAVNREDAAAGVPEATSLGETIPLLQDTAAAGVWALWSVQYRDLVILDDANGALGVFNLTTHNLSWKPEYDAVLAYLRLQAGE
jgi:hypothetical protein